MDQKDAFLKRLLATFKLEADEYVQQLSRDLIELEGTLDGKRRQEIVETTFRLAHSLKGAARAVDRTDVESVCQSVESVLSVVKRGALALSSDLINLLLEASDRLALLLQAESPAPQLHVSTVAMCGRLSQAALGTQVSSTSEPVPQPTHAQALEPQPKADFTSMAAKSAATATADDLALISKAGPTTGNSMSFVADPHAQPAPRQPEDPPRSDSIRISAAKLDALLLQIEGLLTVKLAASQRSVDLRESRQMIAVLVKERRKLNADIRSLQSASTAPLVGVERTKELPRARRMLDYLNWEEGALRALDTQLGTVAKATERDRRNLDGMVDNLLNDAKKALILPVAPTLEVFAKQVRDLARDSGKEVSLRIVGGDIEIDRRILEQVRDPLLHLVRNCIDHGIEMPSEREKLGKPSRGTIEFRVTQRHSEQVEICVEDDGGGVDLKRLRAVALNLGVYTAAELDAMTPAQLVDLMFLSGISTKDTVTQISGRGLGLAIVREKVEQLGGSVEVTTRLQQGTSFRLSLPVTLATYRGVHVRANDRQFVFPTPQVEQVTTIRCEHIRTVERQQMIPMGDAVVPLARLADLLELPRQVAVPDQSTLAVVVVGQSVQRIALVVDEIVGEQEVLVKSLGPQLKRVRNIAAVTVLGSGRVVPILQVTDLIKSAARLTQPVWGGGTAVDAESVRKSIMVAEDSITSRLLIKGVLEAAGYRVTTAVDGEEALAQLRVGSFDLVVSDVEMPRMGGLDLTREIRADAGLAALPVVLVTALSTPADRERGIEVGASAYIVKGSFDQSNLLDVVAQLL